MDTNNTRNPNLQNLQIEQIMKAVLNISAKSWLVRLWKAQW